MIALIVLLVGLSGLFTYLVYPRPFPGDFPANTMTNTNYKRVDALKRIPKKTGARYAVIGGGFLGRNIINMLLLRGETNIKVFDMANVKDLDPRAEFVRGNITKYEEVREFLQDVDVCYTTAALIRYYHDLPHQYQMSYDVNVRGTENILNACIVNNVSYLIATSSSTVTMGYNNIYVGMTEDDPIPPKKPFNHYITTKAIAEKNLRAADKTKLQNGKLLRTAVIRPASAIFGYGDVLNAQLLLQPEVVVFPGVHIFDYVFVENVAFAHLLLEDKMRNVPEKVCGEAFLVSNGEPITRNEWYSMWKCFTPQLKIKMLPVWFVWILAYFSSFVQSVGKGVISLGTLDSLTPSVLAFMGHNCTFTTDKALRLLGYTPLYSVAEGIQKTIDIARAKGDI